MVGWHTAETIGTHLSSKTSHLDKIQEFETRLGKKNCICINKTAFVSIKNIKVTTTWEEQSEECSYLEAMKTFLGKQTFVFNYLEVFVCLFGFVLF